MKRDEFYSVIAEDAVADMVATVSTPAFLYFSQLVRQRHADLKGCLPSVFQIYYAVKANPNSELLRELSTLGVGADVASLGELTMALATGIDPERIEFSGPGKSTKELTVAIQRNISSINAESLLELDIIAQLSRELGIRANVGVRINPRSASDEAGISMSGDTQFGIPLCQLPEALTFIQAGAGLSFTGLHVHSGSQILSSSALIENFRVILDIALETAELGILPIRKVNFGGGWGITYFSSQVSLNMKHVAEGLKDVFSNAKYARLSRIRHIVEPGRFLVGECGLYVTRVLYKKLGARKRFLIVDGGMHQHYLLAGGMGQVIRRNFETDIVAAGPHGEASPNVYDIAGCLCTPQDILATNVLYEREVHVGDRIVFFNSGAYGLTASPMRFLGHELPIEVVV
jgi:diaminopimelate decarboxylase